MTRKHDLHAGELFLQKLRGTPVELTASLPNYIERDMPQQHADFFAGLSYLPLATLDSHGRPWVSILVTASDTDPSVGAHISGHNQIDLVAETNPYDPFIRALTERDNSQITESSLFAGVGIDFTSRRRNKIAGSIGSVAIDRPGKVSLRLNSDQHLGNCPKYITVRSLEHQARDAELAFESLEALTSPLPEDAKALISKASTIFLATKHTSEDEKDPSDARDMGLNHRGGARGFVRLYEDADGDTVTTYLVLPDYSGNRFYQSLGNIETDKQVGLVLPDFTTGDVLYVTGHAENLRDGEAQAIMPRIGMLTRVQLTGAFFVKRGLNLCLISDEQHSPYNPPLKYLRRELEEMGRSPDSFDVGEPMSATLVSTERLSDKITTFTFGLSSPIDAPLPGGFGVFDFSAVLNAGYRHMSEANPQLVNEDYVRTWTFSSAPDFDADTQTFLPTNRVSVTVKRKSGGLMSNVLHDYGDQLIERRVQIGFKGTGVGFSCFTSDADRGLQSVPSKMLWIAGGVGITPFMTMWDGILNVANATPDGISSDIVLLFSGRDDDISVLQHFLPQERTIPDHLKLRIIAFQSIGEDPSGYQSVREMLQNEIPKTRIQIEQRRLQISDLSTIDDLEAREIFVCGPDPLMKWIDNSLDALNVDKSRRHQESFFF